MSKKFVKGNTYVFTKKKFIKAEGKSYYKGGKGWIDEVNGQEVVISGDYDGYISGYGIYPEWCKCIKVGNKA